MKTILSQPDFAPARAAARAFTLLELLAVVVLLGLAAGGVALHLHGVTAEARLRAATVELEQALRRARHQALTRHRPVWVELQPGTGVYRTTTGAADGPWQTLQGVIIERAAFQAQGFPVPPRDDAFAVRITPAGASLPWGVALRAGSAHRVLWTDGLTARWQVGADGEWDDMLGRTEARGRAR